MYKESYRMPTFNELYYFRSGNKNLRPERAHEYNAGITWQSPQMGFIDELTLTADGYFNDVTDKIVAFPTTYVWKMANYGHVHITGIDATLSAQCRIGAKVALNLGANYTLQQAIDITTPDAQGYGMQLPYTPIHSGSGRILITTPWVNMGYSVIAASERYSMSDPSPRYRIDSYAEHTLTLSHTFALNKTSLTARAEAINFTNAQYEIIQYYPMPGQQFRVAISIKL
jgi:outer membrane cobalamin receptor